MSDICPRCKRPKGGLFDCRNCLSGRNRYEMRRYQLGRLMAIAAGKGELVIHKKPSGDHAQTFSPYTKDGRDYGFFCGGAPSDYGKDKRLVLAPEKRRRRVKYAGAGYALVCEKCREAIEELLAEAREGEAIRTA